MDYKKLSRVTDSIRVQDAVKQFEKPEGLKEIEEPSSIIWFKDVNESSPELEKFLKKQCSSTPSCVGVLPGNDDIVYCWDKKGYFGNPGQWYEIPKEKYTSGWLDDNWWSLPSGLRKSFAWNASDHGEPIREGFPPFGFDWTLAIAGEDLDRAKNYMAQHENSVGSLSEDMTRDEVLEALHQKYSEDEVTWEGNRNIISYVKLDKVLSKAGFIFIDMGEDSVGETYYIYSR